MKEIFKPVSSRPILSKVFGKSMLNQLSSSFNENFSSYKYELKYDLVFCNSFCFIQKK